MAKAWEIININPEDSLKVVLPKILKRRFEEMLSYEKGMIVGKDIEFLHDMRVSCRRVQAVLKIFRSCYPKKKYREEYAKLKSLIRLLGDVRELDVYIDMLEKYKNTLSEKDSKPIDLLIIRQNTNRRQKRKLLVEMMKKLNSKGFREKFANLYC